MSGQQLAYFPCFLHLPSRRRSSIIHRYQLVQQHHQQHLVLHHYFRVTHHCHQLLAFTAPPVYARPPLLSLFTPLHLSYSHQLLLLIHSVDISKSFMSHLDSTLLYPVNTRQHSSCSRLQLCHSSSSHSAHSTFSLHLKHLSSSLFRCE